MPNLTTIADWAKSMNISRQQGYAAVNRCGIPVTDGKLDPDVATVLYQKHTRVRMNAKRGANSAGAGEFPASGEGQGTGPGYENSRARREEAEATIAEMKLAEMEGKYLLRDEVETVVFEVARALRDGLMNSALRIAADVAAMTTGDECEAVVSREHRALLGSMIHTFNAKLRVVVDLEGPAE